MACAVLKTKLPGTCCLPKSKPTGTGRDQAIALDPTDRHRGGHVPEQGSLAFAVVP